MTQKTQEMPEALRLSNEWRIKQQREANRKNSAYDVFGMGNTPETVDPLGSKMAAELRRQHAEIERLKGCVKELELMKYLRDGLAAEIPRDDLLTLAQDAYDYLDDAEEIDQGRALSIARGMMQDMAKAIFQLVAQNKAAGAQEGELCMLYALEQAECSKLRAELAVLRRSLTKK